MTVRRKLGRTLDGRINRRDALFDAYPLSPYSAVPDKRIRMLRRFGAQVEDVVEIFSADRGGLRHEALIIL